MAYTDDIKETDDLKQQLMQTADLDSFLSENSGNFNDKTIQELINALYVKTDMTKAELARRSGVSTVYLHQLFSGRRNPSREKLICIAIGLGASLDETQEMLRRSGFAELYAKDKRDAIIIFGIAHGKNLLQVNDDLFDKNMETLM